MAATGPEFCAGKDQNLPPLDVWLDEHGLGKYVSCFKRAGADLALVMNLSEEDLRSMGVATLGARKKIKLGVEELKDDLLASGADDKENVGVGAKPGSILRFFQGPSSTAAPPLPTTKLKQLQPAVKAPGKTSAWAHAAPKGSGRRWGGPRAAAVIPVRSWQLVPGTGFVVDRFSNLPPSTPNHKHWFLTHFHADHYKGLTSR